MKARLSNMLFLLVLIAPNILHGQEIKVLVLDASSGKPQPGVEIQYYCAGRTRNSPNSAPVLTHSDGLAKVPITCSETQKMDLRALPPDPKEQCGELPLLTLQEITSSGVVANPGADGNIWCSDKVSRKMKAAPGQITLFVKKPTWFQSHF